MAAYFEGKLQADGFRFDIVVARFNAIFGERVLDGCLDALRRHGASDAAIRVIRVPGAFEIAPAVRRLVREGDADAIVALGVLIRGETPHFDHIAQSVARGIGDAASEADRPIAFGVLTCDTPEQAEERSGGKGGNKGWDAALAAIEMANLFRELRREGTRPSSPRSDVGRLRTAETRKHGKSPKGA